MKYTSLNENLKFTDNGKCVAEFLIMPRYRRNHIGQKVAIDIFNMYKGNWEVEPIANSKIAYCFWKNTIAKFTNSDYKIKKSSEGAIFVFKSL